MRFLAAGWDNEPFMVGEDWVFRFPKRAQQVPWLLREIEAMPVVAEALGSMVPRFEHVGEPSPAFPYPFDDLEVEVHHHLLHTAGGWPDRAHVVGCGLYREVGDAV